MLRKDTLTPKKLLSCDHNTGLIDFIAGDDTYHNLAACPFFDTYKDEETEGAKKALLPFFRYF